MVEYEITPETAGFRSLTISNGSSAPTEDEITSIEGREALDGFKRIGPYSIGGREGKWEVLYHRQDREHVQGMTAGVPNGRY